MQNTKVKLQGYTFVVDLYVLPLVGCDMVLGIQWLRTLGPILWDFLNLTMQFVYEERTYLLEGLASNMNFSVEDDESFKLNSSENKGVLLQLLGDEIKQKQANNFGRNHNKEVGPMAQLLEEFANIFADPKELALKRSHDHAIHLKEGAQPVSVRPYLYPFYQKQEIEKIVKELLQSGSDQMQLELFLFSNVTCKEGRWQLEDMYGL